MDSKPEELDRLDRRLIQLKIEREALKKEKDEASKVRLIELEETIAEVAKEASALEEVWVSEKAQTHGVQAIKEELDRAEIDLEQARRAGDLARMSEIQYGVIPSLEKRMADAQEANESDEGKLVRSRVTEEEIAEVVSRWTGIPVAKMLDVVQPGCCNGAYSSLLPRDLRTCCDPTTRLFRAMAKMSQDI